MASPGETSRPMGFILIFRPGNCVMAAAAVFLAALICSSLETMADRILEIGMSVVVVLAFVAGANTLNDYRDRELDKVAHPMRPVPLGIITPKAALATAALLLGAALVLGWIISAWSFVIVITSLAVILAYELLLKSEGLVGNMAISWLTAALFLFGGAAVDGMELAWILAALAFFASLGREIIKDIQDVGGDAVSRKTLPMRIGVRNAGVLASAVLATAVILSPIPFLLSLVSAWYMPFVAVVDTVFIYGAMIHFADPEQGQKVIKLAMLTALLAFLFGGIG